MFLQISIVFCFTTAMSYAHPTARYHGEPQRRFPSTLYQIPQTVSPRSNKAETISEGEVQKTTAHAVGDAPLLNEQETFLEDQFPTNLPVDEIPLAHNRADDNLTSKIASSQGVVDVNSTPNESPSCFQLVDENYSTKESASTVAHNAVKIQSHSDEINQSHEIIDAHTSADEPALLNGDFHPPSPSGEYSSSDEVPSTNDVTDAQPLAEQALPVDDATEAQSAANEIIPVNDDARVQPITDKVHSSKEVVNDHSSNDEIILSNGSEPNGENIDESTLVNAAILHDILKEDAGSTENDIDASNIKIHTSSDLSGMPYHVEWKIDDLESNNIYSHTQNSNGNRVEGEYRVALPDGRVQIVKFYDDGSGYVAEVFYMQSTSVTLQELDESASH